MTDNGLRSEENFVQRPNVAAYLNQLGERLGYSDLTIHQQQAILEFVSGHNVLVVLPSSILPVSRSWVLSGCGFGTPMTGT